MERDNRSIDSVVTTYKTPSYKTPSFFSRAKAYVAGAVLLGAASLPGCANIVGRPGPRAFVDPDSVVHYADHGDGLIANIQEALDDPNPHSVTRSYIPDFFIADKLVWPIRAITHSGGALYRHVDIDPENNGFNFFDFTLRPLAIGVGLFFNVLDQVVLNVAAHSPAGSYTGRIAAQLINGDAYQRDVNWGMRGSDDEGLAATRELSADQSGAHFAYDVIKVLTTTGAIAGGVIGSDSGDSGSSGSGSNPGTNVPRIGGGQNNSNGAQ